VRRGILGGTFDPPHVAHLFAAESAYRELGLDVVTFVPAGAPWQKSGRVVADAEDRLEMTRLVVGSVAYFEVDDREVTRDGWTYTVDTLAEFPNDDLVLILGSDAAAGLPSWHRPDEVVQMAELAVVPRPGTPIEAVDMAIPGGFHWLAGPELDVSGTMLRTRVGAGRSIRFLVPDAVADYIEDRRLYRNGDDPASQ
jgi:nicotinate-nucleotide adenylyltransferase